MSIPSVTREQITSCARRVGRRIVIDASRFDAIMVGEEPDPKARPRFVTIRQLSELHPDFTEAAIRQLLAKSEKPVSK